MAQQPPLYSNPTQPVRARGSPLAQILQPGLAPQPVSATNGIFVTSQNIIEVTSWGSLSGVTLRISYRIEKPNIVPQILTQTHVADSARTSGGTVTTFPLGNGQLTLLGVSVAAGSPKRGQTYVRLSLLDSTGSTARIKLLAGYAVLGRDIAWTPGTVFDEDPLSGAGYRQVLKLGGSAYLAGSTINLMTVPTRALRKVTDAFFTASSSRGSFKNMGVMVTDGAGGTVDIYLVTKGVAVAKASASYEAVTTHGLAQPGTFSSNDASTGPMPPWLGEKGLPGSWRIYARYNQNAGIGSIKFISGSALPQRNITVEEFIDPS